MYKIFDPNDPKLIKAFADALELACKQFEGNLKCLDWFNILPVREKKDWGDIYEERCGF